MATYTTSTASADYNNVSEEETGSVPHLISELFYKIQSYFGLLLNMKVIHNKAADDIVQKKSCVMPPVKSCHFGLPLLSVFYKNNIKNFNHL